MSLRLEVYASPAPSASWRLPPKISGDANLVDYHFVNPSLNALKFDAAASFQLPQKHKSGCEHLTGTDSDGLLVVSPYTSRSHLLDLSGVTKPNQLLAMALTSFKPILSSYATAPYISAFNWVEVMECLRVLAKNDTSYHWQEQVFYLVVFRSQIPPTTDRSHLGSLDEVSHAEAMHTGGLLKYWFGEPDDNGRNLATCVWREHADAKRGSSGDGHHRAMRATSKLYTEWKVERLKLVIGKNVEHWDIMGWKD